MEGLLEKVLAPFQSGGDQLWLVSDPNHLLAEESVQLALSERAITVISYVDPIAFRFDFSRQRDEQSSVAIVVNDDAQGLDDLPWDLLQQGKKIPLDAAALFPAMDTRVLEVLTLEDLPLLYRAIELYQPERMNFVGSLDFVLRHVYGSAPEIIQSQSDLLRLLLRKHYQGAIFPEIIDERLAKLLCLSFPDLSWPLEDCVLDRTAFLAFMQREWAKFVASIDEPGESVAAISPQWWQTRRLLPFDHPDIRVYIDNFFAEGLLVPIDCQHPDNFQDSWMLIGLNTNPQQHLARRMTQMQRLCRDEMPEVDANHQQWQSYARQWGELRYLTYTNEWDEDVHLAITELEQTLDQHFTAWMLQRFGGLHNQPGRLPTMVHMIPRFMARCLEQNGTKRIALLVMDGMAFDQWLALKSQLPDEIRITESASFAWVPTITSVSRQAIFAGKAPRHFASSINTTNKEASLWNTYWQDQGLTASSVYYQRAIGDGDIEQVLESLSDRRLKVAGLVCNAVDDRMHGALDGLSGLHVQLQHWAQSGFFNQLVSGLIELGYEVVITADHGNAQAIGQGKPAEGVISERHERARIYKDEILREEALNKFDGIKWPDNFGLPEDYLPVLAKGRSAFVKQDEKNVGHGGIAIEEVIVPFVHVRSNN